MTEHLHTLRLSLLVPQPAQCAACATRLRASVAELPGVSFVEVDPKAATLTVRHDTQLLSEDELEREAERLGFEIASAVGHATYKLTGLDCPDCARTVDRSVSYVDGVLAAELNFASELLSVEYDPAQDPRDEIVSMIRKMGYGIAPLEQPGAPAVAEFRLLGLDCPDCAKKLQQALGGQIGVNEAAVDFATARLRIGYDPATTSIESLAKAVSDAGYAVEVAIAEEGTAAAQAPWLQRNRQEVMTGVAIVAFAIGWLLGRVPVLHLASIAAYVVAIVAGGEQTGRRALASIRTRTLDMNVLMSVAVVGAAAIGEWNEAAAVIVLFSIGNLLEARSLAKTRASIRSLMALAPQKARVRRGDHEAEVMASAVAVGETLIVRPGERMPLDGIVVSGSSALDEAPITGESVPVEKNEGDAVYAGTLNTSGLLDVRTTALATESTLARVIYLVEEAQGQRAPSQRLVDRFTRYYTPAVVALAVVVAVVPPLVGVVTGLQLGTFAEWFGRALVLLVISCPCALVISTPVAIVSAITRATRDGVLVKGGAYLEAAPRVRAVAIDKTGTLTCGQPEVADVVALDGQDADGVLRLAAALESNSNHPLARAVVRAAGNGHVDGRELRGYEDIPGRGVRATIDGVAYALGSPASAEQSGALNERAIDEVARLESDGLTVLVLSSADKPLGLVGLADQVRAEAPAVVASLRRLGVQHIVMLTGDNERTAAAVARHAGVTETRPRLLPEDKVAAVRELREQYGSVAMVGDGVNDAPALAAADIGIAMGAKGSDTALETSDVALMAEDLNALPGFFRLGNRTVANIRQNVVVSIVVKLVVLVAAVFGFARLWMAVFADSGVALLVTLNGLRLLTGRRSG